MSDLPNEAMEVDGDLPHENQELTGKECLERCQMFADITGTNTAHAASILQDCNWNVSKALTFHFGWNQLETILDERVDNQANLTNSQQQGSSSTTSSLSGYEGSRLRVLSWNLDGLDSKNLNARTRFVADCILRERCHFVLLQEVVSESETILRECLDKHYHILSARTDPSSADYYCAILMHKATITFPSEKPMLMVEQFQGTCMGRNLLITNAIFNGQHFIVMTAHLESTLNYASARKMQLQTCWNKMRKLSEEHPNAVVVFAGDLNLRDSEVTALGGLPPGISDMWIVCKSRPEACGTWDPQRNYNAGSKMQGSDSNHFHRRNSGMRYDRMYLAQNKRVDPIYFELGGLEKVPGFQCHASDHWAILTHFDVCA